MRLVGLISGGKDSLYNLLQCISAGHEIVAVANIEPETKEELDSYMYQSVGHELITLIAGALCLPIYRQKTKGKAICQNKVYMKTPQDEVEDLILLLNKVKKGVKIDGVAVGAIASDYQRTRVENVCSRLGLKCFAYLWRRNQMELLQEMIDANFDAIIIKVACIGLNANHLGLSIGELQPYFSDLNKKYGMNVCGEGGEYETITLDCPLFHRSITITESEKVCLSDDPFAPACFLNVKNAFLSLKSWEIDGSSVTSEDKISIITKTIKNPFAYVEDCVDELSEARTPVTTPELPFPFEMDETEEGNPPVHLNEYWKQTSLLKTHKSVSSSLTVAPSADTSVMNLNLSSGWCCLGNVTGSTIAEAMKCAEGHLKRMNYSFQEVVFVNLFVRDISSFGSINLTYAQHMPETKPPARACVEVPLPPETDVMLIVLAHKTVSKSRQALGSNNLIEREVLHVQSISHWAPANIGPYSQCIEISGIYHVAGQIPLIPGAMEILNKPIFHQCKLALRHVLRILQAMNEALSYSNILQATCYVTSEKIAADMSSLWSHVTNVHHTPVAVIVVSNLPKMAQLEWEVIACCGDNPQVNEETRVIEEFNLYKKKCFYRERFLSSIVCKFSYFKNDNKTSKNLVKSLKFVTPKGLHSALNHCIDFLRDVNTGPVRLCMLKIFYKASDAAVSAVLKEIIPSFIEGKVIATAIPVLACEDPDVFLTLTGVCF